MDLKSNIGNSKNGTDADKGLVERIQMELKGMIFKVIQQMMKDEDQSVLVYGFMLIIQFMQICYIPFNHNIWKVWQNETVTQQIRNVTAYFLFSNYFSELDFESFSIMLYVCVGLVVLSIMLVFIISYSFNKQKISFTWPIYILRFLVGFFITIFYMPIMDMFFKTITCKTNENGTLEHVYFQNVECWNNMHIVHSIVAIAFIIIYFTLCIIISLTYFECRYIPNDAQSKLSGRPLAIFFTYELIMIISYCFMDGKEFHYLMIAIMLIGSYVVFWKNHIQNPYYNFYISKLWSILVSVHLWSVLLLTFSKFLEGILFFGTIYAWITGIPLLIIAIFRTEKQNFDLLLLNIQKAINSDAILQQCDYLLHLYHLSANNQNASLILDGYLEIHRATCNRDDCYLQTKKSSNYRHQKQVLKDGNERDNDLIMIIGQTFFNGIKKFPNDITLRIRYAFFLLDNMKQKQQALNELIQAEQMSPSFDNEFLIYRYKKIIEDEMNNQQNEGNQDFASELSFQTSMRSFQNKIERATLMHMDFWSQLQEDNPDLGKLNNIGAKINYSIQQVEEHWNKMQKMTHNLPKAMRLYGKFIIDILQDKEFGEKLLDKSRILTIQNNKIKNKQSIQMVSSDDIQSESQPTILVSTSQEKYAQIINLNLASCNVFGYNKSELLNRKINLLMPNMYIHIISQQHLRIAKFHDQHLDHYLQGQEGKYFNKERMIFIKQKSNYVVPAFINLKQLQQLDDNIQIVAQFRLIKTFKPSCYLLIDYDFIIDSISASCITLLGLDSKSIFHRKTSINDIFQSFEESKEIYLSKSGGTLIYNPNSTDIQVSQDELALLQEDNQIKQDIKFNCTITPIYGYEETLPVGFVVKLDQLISDVSEILQPPMNNKNQFQLKYNLEKLIYYGEFLNGDSQNSVRIDQSILWDQNEQSSMASKLFQNINPQSEKTEEAKIDLKQQQPTQVDQQQKINYGEGIKTVRLFDGRIHDIDDLKEEMEEEEDNENKVIMQKNQNQEDDQEFSLNDYNNIFKSRKNLNAVVNNYQTPIVIRNLKIVANLLILILLVISFVDYFLTQAQFGEIETNIIQVKESNERSAEFQIVLTSVQNLKILSADISNEPKSKDYEQLQKDIIESRIYHIDQLHKKLMLDEEELTDKFKELATSDSINMQFWGGKNEKYDLNEATQQMITKALNIKNIALEEMIENNPDVYFVEYNLLNHYYLGLKLASNLYAEQLKKKTQDQSQLFVIILIVSASTLTLAIFILVPVMLQVNYNQEKILSLFLDIPDKTVKYLYNKSENFISNLQIGEEEEVLSEMEEMEKEQQEELSRTLKSKKKKKRFKNTNKNQRNYIFFFIIVILIFQSYYIFNYFMSTILLDNMNQLVAEINVTAQAESFYRFADNVQTQLYLNQTYPILNMSAYDAAKENINQLYALDSSMHQEHSINVQIQNSIYQNAFNQILMLNPCPIFSNVMKTVKEEECNTYAEGSIQQGMAVGLTRYFENLRYMLTIYDQFYDNPEANFTLIAKAFAVEKQGLSPDPILNRILNLLNFNQTIEARNVQTLYIESTYRYLMDQFFKSINDDIQFTNTQRLALFIVFDVFLFIVYFILWLPLVMKMTRDIWRTRSMIIMIPLKVIQRVKTIKMFIKDFLQAKDIDTQ